MARCPPVALYAVALVAVALVGCVPDQPVRSPLDAVLVDVLCADEVRSSLREWGAGKGFLEAPPSGDGARSYRFPTSEFAEWVVLTVPDAAPPRVVLVTVEQAVGRLFAGDCSWETRGRMHEPVSTDASQLFTDAELRGHLDAADGVPVVVYVWAPHMPLSADGYREIAEAGRALGMPVVPVLIAFSDTEFAEREARRTGIPPAGLKQIDSNELVQRQAQVHAPSIIVFGADRVSPVLPGYRNAAGYREYLEAFLDGGG
jgi:hypothetical protein